MESHFTYLLIFYLFKWKNFKSSFIEYKRSIGSFASHACLDFSHLSRASTPVLPPVESAINPCHYYSLCSSLISHHPLFLDTETGEMKAKVKGRYEGHRSAASAVFSITSGDLKLTAALTDATFSNPPSPTGLAISLHKPDAFSLVFDVLKKVYFSPFLEALIFILGFLVGINLYT